MQSCLNSSWPDSNDLHISLERFENDFEIKVRSFALKFHKKAIGAQTIDDFGFKDSVIQSLLGHHSAGCGV